MGLTSEQVHHAGGAAFSLVAALLLLWHLRIVRWSWTPLALPMLLVGYGIESFVDTWVHGSQLPSSYDAETFQHFIQGGTVTIAGIVEALVLREKLRHRVWHAAVPLALAVVAVVFLLHDQHDATVDPLALAVQHRMFAVTLLVAAAAKALAELPRENAWLRAGWVLPLLVFGLQLLVYSEKTMMSHVERPASVSGAVIRGDGHYRVDGAAMEAKP